MVAKLSKVDVETAEAFDPKDKAMIHAAIRTHLKGGHADLNGCYQRFTIVGES